MFIIHLGLVPALWSLVLVNPVAEAKVSQEEAAKLGKELTPLGAIRGGNAEGTIPPWEGGILQPPPGYKRGMHHPDPFADDQPLFTITAANAGEHKDNLSSGHIALLKRYPDSWKMVVYPTRRSSSFPQQVYEAAIANATKAELAPAGNGVVNAVGGVPFPIPKEGVEAVWNHIVRYRGKDGRQVVGQVTPTATGNYTFVLVEQKLNTYFHDPAETRESITDMNRIYNFTQRVMAPARIAGQVLLVNEPINQVAEARKSWLYVPGQRRVRRAPNNAYDNPGTAVDGQRTNDQNDMYNGSPDRYNWSLVGRREMYVPYNAYKLHSDKVQYDDIIKPGHLNADLLRYELHRVWVVEGKVKEGLRHIYARRVFFIDEDSWNILVAEHYDSRDEIWRVSEAHVINYYEVPLIWTTVDVHMDLQNGRYTAIGLNNQHPIEQFNSGMSQAEFTPAALRRVGRR